MLQADEPDTFVLATGRTETVRDFVRMAFAAAGYQLEWSDKEERETGYRRGDRQDARARESEVLPAGRSGFADRLRGQGAREARLGAAHESRATLSHDGSRGSWAE